MIGCSWQNRSPGLEILPKGPHTGVILNPHNYMEKALISQSCEFLDVTELGDMEMQPDNSSILGALFIIASLKMAQVGG